MSGDSDGAPASSQSNCRRHPTGLKGREIGLWYANQKNEGDTDGAPASSGAASMKSSHKPQGARNRLGVHSSQGDRNPRNIGRPPAHLKGAEIGRWYKNQQKRS